MARLTKVQEPDWREHVGPTLKGWVRRALGAGVYSVPYEVRLQILIVHATFLKPLEFTKYKYSVQRKYSEAGDLLHRVLDSVINENTVVLAFGVLCSSSFLGN